MATLQYSCLENPMDREEPGRLWSRGSQRVRHDLAGTHTKIPKSQFLPGLPLFFMLCISAMLLG